MANPTIYHNPRCSKSRATLALLRDRGLEPNIVEYLTNPPDVDTLGAIADMLSLRPIDLVRKKEPPFAQLALDGKHDDAVLAAMVANPVLIQRPIVVVGNKAAIGRPPENVLAIL